MWVWFLVLLYQYHTVTYIVGMVVHHGGTESQDVAGGRTPHTYTFETRID